MVQVKNVKVVDQPAEDEKKRKYKVLPPEWSEEIDQEVAKVDVKVAMQETEDPEYWIDPEEIDGAGAITVDAGKVMKTKGTQRLDKGYPGGAKFY